MSTAETAYGILACLESLTGARATGSVTVAAAGADVTLPIHSFGIPVVTSEGGERYLDWSYPIRTTEERVVTAAGVAVAVRANCGGARSNLPVGTPIRWFPVVGGVEEMSVVAAGGVSGGAEPLEDHAFRSLVWYQEIPAAGPIPDEVVRAAVSRTPAGILSWTGSGGDDNTGARKAIRTDRWSLVIVVEKAEAHHARARQALALLDLCHGLLLDRRGLVVQVGTQMRLMSVSNPGIKVTGRRPRQTGPNLYAYEITFETRQGVEGLDAPAGMYGDWLQTRYDFPTLASETGSHTSTLAVVEGATYPQP